VKTVVKSLTVAFACMCLTGSAYAGLLDDFSTSNESNYQFLPVWNGPSDGWNVSGGVLNPTIPGNATGAWLWNGAQLSSVGDMVSLNFWIMNPDGGYGTAAGLFVADALTSPTVTAEISLLTWPGGGEGGSVLQFNGTASSSLSVAELQTGFSTLTITMTEQLAGSSTYLVDLSGGGLSEYIGTFTLNASSVYFGPGLYDGNSSGDVVYDNLTIGVQPVPEPSALALAGLGGLLLFRRRKIKLCFGKRI
jgi:hypothetical protein